MKIPPIIIYLAIMSSITTAMNPTAIALAAATSVAYGVSVTYATYTAVSRYWGLKNKPQFLKLEELTKRIIGEFAAEFEIPISILRKVADRMVTGMQEFSLDGYSQTGLRTLSFKHDFPNGNEKGFFYGVNLRPNTLLILCSRLHGNNDNEPVTDIYRDKILIPPIVISGHSEVLFDFIAKEVATFVEAHPDNRNGDLLKKKKLGFTISYPVDDDPATSLGNAIKWERFSAYDEVGKELAKIMNQALDKHGVNLEVSAMVDETIGNLAAARYYDKDTIAAVTLDMGTDAVYLESAQELAQLNDALPNSSETVINFGWINFTSRLLSISKFDFDLDCQSARPGKQMFQKMISGMYLGEIVRLVLVRIGYETKIFGDCLPKKLTTPYLLRLPDMLAILEDVSVDLKVVGQKLNEIFGVTDSTILARTSVVELCEIALVRAARLAGAGIVGILKKVRRIEDIRSVVSIGGGLCEAYLFQNELQNIVWEMLECEDEDAILEDFKIGSDMGSIFLAASGYADT